jgi:hypothetical protein
VTFHPGAVKDLGGLDRPVQKQIRDVIDGLSMGQVPLNQTHTLRHPLQGWSATKASRGHRIIHRPTEEGGIHVGYIGLHEYGKAERRLGSDRPDLHSRIFGPTKGSLDPRLFDGDKMRPQVREAILERLGAVLEPVLGISWKNSLDVYLAGSEASEWWGNDDLDVLVGLDYDHLEETTLEGVPDEDATALLNQLFWSGYNDEDWHAPFGGVWHATAYANPEIGSGGIKKIKPYAVYDILRNDWLVKPPHLEHWNIAEGPAGPEVVDEAKAYADLIDAIDKLPEPYRTQQGTSLWDHLHADRGRAFSDRGEGWYDPGNVIEKALNEWGLWDKLVDIKYHSAPGSMSTPEGWSNQPVVKTSATGPLVRRGINVSPGEGWDPEAAHRIVSGNAKPEDLLKHIDLKNVGHWWYHSRDGDLEDAQDHATSYGDEHLKKAMGDGLYGGKYLGDVAVAMEGHHQGHWDPTENPSDPLMGNSYIEPGAKVHIHKLHYSPDWGSTWHELPVDAMGTNGEPEKHTAGKNGDLPEGLTFKHRPPTRLYPNEHVLVAHHPDGDDTPWSKYAGHITWFQDEPEVAGINVAHGFQRKGLATELWKRANQITPGLEHSKDLTSDGKNWISSLGLRMVAEDDDYRMQHRPPDREGIPIHDLAQGMPADVYTHPHYYDPTGGDPSDSSYSEAYSVIHRVKNKPNAKVRIYRSLPAEHAHQGFRPGDWITTSKDYARQHGKHNSDPKHDWPVISTTVKADDLHTDADDLREYGYNGPTVSQGSTSVAFKGGHHQEIRQHATGEIHRVTRRPKQEGQEMWGSHTLKLSPEDYHHALHGYLPGEGPETVLKHLGPDVTWHPKGSQHGPIEVDDPADSWAAEHHAKQLLEAHHPEGGHEPGTAPLLGVIVHTKNGKTIDRVQVHPHLDFGDQPRGFHNGFTNLPFGGGGKKHPSLQREAAYGGVYYTLVA